jgi:hypothetical protein
VVTVVEIAELRAPKLLPEPGQCGTATVRRTVAVPPSRFINAG